MTHHAQPQHPCAAAGCTHYRKAMMPARIMEWCQRMHTPMSPCAHIRTSDHVAREGGTFCARPQKKGLQP